MFWPYRFGTQIFPYADIKPSCHQVPINAAPSATYKKLLKGHWNTVARDWPWESRGYCKLPIKILQNSEPTMEEEAGGGDEGLKRRT
jgi:hypothetical protein